MMITLKDFMEATNYRITEGSTYGWSCYGNHAYMIDSSCDIDKHSFTVVFDTESQEVYEATAYDYINDRAYRMINPEFVHSHTSESNQRSLNGNEAWEGVMYTELEVVGDYLEKVRGIITGEQYDTRIQVPLDLPDSSIFQLMLMSHEADQTLNEFISNLLKSEIDRMELDTARGTRNTK